MQRYLAVFFLIFSLVAGVASAQVWEIDKVHSSVGFSVRHLVVSNVRGYFRDFGGQVTFDGKNLAGGAVEVTIQVASIDTDNADRDKHLLSEDFFQTDAFPTMTFKSKKIIPGEGNQFTMVGDLTMKGITREVSLDGEFNGVVDDPWGNTRAGFSAQTTINRQDFRVNWDSKLKDGSLVVGNDVKINLEMELIKKK